VQSLRAGPGQLFRLVGVGLSNFKWTQNRIRRSRVTIVLPVTKVLRDRLPQNLKNNENRRSVASTQYTAAVMVVASPLSMFGAQSAFSQWGISVVFCPGSVPSSSSCVSHTSFSGWLRKSRSLLAGALTAGILASVASSPAQAQKPQVLHNHVRPEVSSGQAPLVGAMPPTQTMNFSIVLPPRNQADLDSFLARLYDPASPDFHHFLTVDEFTQRYGPTPGDYQAVVAFAQAHGFIVNGAPANRLAVPLTGTVNQIESAFNVRMSLYQHPTENRTFFSPDREPSLNLSVPVAHIAGLDNFSLPHPMVIPPSQAHPQLANVAGSGPGGSYLGSDMRAAYYGGTTLDGNGQAVGLLEFDGYNIGDVNSTFSNADQTYNVAINNVLLDGATGLPITPDGTAEVVLDIVQAIGMAPGLGQVRVYMGTGSDDANILNSMASENIAKQISCSWNWTPDDPATDDVFFKEFAAQGQAFFVASGDEGAYDATISPYFYPQEDAYITAVGGTHLTTNGAGGAWESETAWNSAPSNPDGSGGGISPDNIDIPSWQSGIANTSNAGSTTYRNVPDVAMEGDFDNYNCSEGYCSGGWAGTSFAAPRWAGFMALVNEQAVEAGNAPLGGIGFLNPSLYTLAEGTPYATDFHDITDGNNDTDNQPTFWSAVAGYDLVTGWGSAAGQHLIDDLAGQQIPGFWLLGSPATVGVLQGSTATTTISVTDAGGFTGHVTLAVTSTLPTGVTASWGTNPTTGSSVLTFTAAATAPASTTPLTITGTSGSLKVTTTGILAVHAPTFTLTPSPAALGISQGSSGTSTVTVTPEYGFTGAVNLSISGLPTGVTASFSPTSTSTTSTLAINAGSSVADGTYSLIITGISGSLTVTTPLVLTVHEPTFALDPPSLINVGQGASGSAIVYMLPEYDFSGSVNLSVSGLPSGVTASFSPNPATVTSPNVAASTLTVTVGSSVPAGTTPITITGTSGSHTVTSTLNLIVQKPTFTLSTPVTVDMGQGTSTSTYVDVIPQYGFTGNVTFSVTGLPAGVTATWNPNPASNYSTLTLMASSSTAVGSSTLTITGTSGSITATSTATLTIHQPSFTVYGPTSVDVGQGTSTNTYAAITPLYGFNGNVTLSVAGLPTGVTALWNPNPTTGSTNLTLTTSSSTPVGSSTLTITGTSGSVKASTTIALTVHALSFTLNTYSSVSMGQGSTGAAYVYITPAYGFSANVNLSVSGLPSGVTATFSTNPATNNSTLTFTASSTAAVGTKTVTITGTSGTLTASTTVALTVNPPSFTISGPGAVSIGRGTTNPLSLYVSPQYGFTGSVNFSVSGLPAGVTASFSPNPTTNSTAMTLTASSTAAIGQSTLTITGTSGSLTSTTTLTVSINAPTFTLSSCCIGSVGQGTSSTATVWVYPQYGFSGNVTLSISGLPSGVTASFSPNPVSASGTVYSASSTLTLTVSSTATPGQYPLTITGTSGAVTATTPIALSINPPSFTMYGGSLNMGQGATAASSVYLYPQYGLTGSISLSISGLPAGVTASLVPNPVSIATTTYSALSTLTVTTSGSAAPGQYTLTVTGTSGSQSVTTGVPLTINAPGFTLYCSTCATSLNQGASTQTTVTVSPQYGFAGSVNLAVTGLPSGVTGSFSPNPTTSTSTLTLSASAEAAPVNAASFTITGSSGSLIATTTGNITVNSQGFSLLNAPGEINLSPGGSGDSTIDLIAVNGFIGNVSFSASGLPSGVTATFSPNPATATTVMTLKAASNAASGSTTVGITGTSGTFTAATSVVVKVNAAAPAATTTNLQISAAGNTVTSVAAETVVTLTATVSAGSTALASGQVNFCAAVATGCDPTHLIGTVQLTSVGTAALKFIPGMGVHSYQAVFVATNADAGSVSAASPLTVTASQPTTTTIVQSGNAGNYTLTATVAGQGAVAPTGTISFLDASDSNAVVGTASLGTGKSALTWGNPQSPTTGSYPQAIAVGDFNRDGVPDLAVPNFSSGTVMVLLGKGDGTFTATASTLQAGTSPSAVVVGDFNGDGIPDLAVSNENSNNVSIFLGNGDGTFTAVATQPETGTSPALIVVGDFNGDGILDLATGNSNSETVTVLLGNGDGTFTASPLSAQTNGPPRSMAVGDFNGDGNLDLVLVGGYSTNLVTILLGNGDGSFAAAAPLALPQNSSPYAVVAGDFNQDGKLDLAIATSSSSSIYIFSGNGDGTFTPTTAAATGLIYPTNLAVADLNADGKPDLVETNSTQVGILLGNGDGSFATATTVSAGNSPDAIAVSDFNGDGTQDLAITNVYGSTVSILTSQLSQTATATATGISPARTGTHNVEASYPGDTSYQSSVSSTVGLQAGKVTPTVTVTPSGSSITEAQTLTVTVTVSGGNGDPAPTGSVTLISGSYTATAATLSNGSATINIPAGSLAVGSDTLGVAYTPDTAGAATYTTATGSGAVTVGKITPTVTVTPSAPSITEAQALTVTVTVSGGNGNPAPTGSVTLTNGSYASVAATLSNGSATINIPAGSLAVGSDTLGVAYTPDAFGAATYNAANGSGSVSVIPAIGTTAATVTLTASAANITNQQSVTVTVTVAGPSGQPTPTGAVTLSGGSYSAQQTLSAGGANFTIATDALANGADTLTAAYSGDPTYATAKATATVTVVPVVIATPALSPVAPGSSATGNVTISAGANYSGTMALSCTLTSSPSGAQSLPTCNLSPTSLTLTSEGTGTSTLTIDTTVVSTESLMLPAQLQLWRLGGTGSLLAALVMFGIPARRRRWVSMLVLLFFVALAGGIGCGGGGSSSSHQTISATTAGTYTFAVKATDASTNVTASANVTLTVQ
jgi:subtilase family serine protease